MDFSVVTLSAEDQEFLERAQRFLTVHATEDLLRRERETGDGFIEELHLAMGAEGWLEPETKGVADGGVTPVQPRIWNLERRRAQIPLERWGSTMMILQAVRGYACPELLAEVLPGVYDGSIRFAMGYTEPEGGSDITTCRTRAQRDGDDWVVNGQKMFTSGAHICQYVFPAGQHRPRWPSSPRLDDVPGSSVRQGDRDPGAAHRDGERSNITYYTDVRIPDRYRLGDVNDGWTVLNGPLSAEHGARGPDPHGLADIAIMSGFGTTVAAADEVLATAGWDRPGQGRLIEDALGAYRLGRAFARIEAAQSTPSIFGRVAVAQTLRDVAPDLMDVLGPASALTAEADGEMAGGVTEYCIGGRR